MTGQKRLVIGSCFLLLWMLTPVNFAQDTASASNCTHGPCIDVLTNPVTGEIIGRARSTTYGTPGHRRSVHRTPVKKRPIPKKKATPIVKPVVNPICTVDQLATFTCLKTFAPVVPAPVVPHTFSSPSRPKIISTDEMRRSLPRTRPGFQPSTGAVVNVPVIYWSGIVTPVHFNMTLLGHVVEVNMHARFFWSWGDGTSLATTTVGAPFPTQSLVHTYSTPGRYRISLSTTWNGSATLGQNSLQIVGAPIESVDELEILVIEAPTRLTPND
jgi:hypothetical protein